MKNQYDCQLILPKPKASKGAKKMTFKFKIGDKVRITQSRNIFSREYDEKWSGEVFNVS